MRIWLLLTGVFLLQEIVSTNVVLLEVYRAHVDVILITLLFLVATAIDIFASYALGTYLKRWVDHSTFVRALSRATHRLAKTLGSNGERIMLIVLPIVTFPYVAGFLASWVGIPISETILYVLIGNVVWYVLEWSVVLGAIHISSHFSLYAVLVLSGAVIVGLGTLYDRFTDEEER